MASVAGQPVDEIPQLHGTAFFPTAGGKSNRRVLLVAGLEEGQEGRVLAQQILDLRDARTRPVLDPRLGQIVFDVVESALVH